MVVEMPCDPNVVLDAKPLLFGHPHLHRVTRIPVDGPPWAEDQGPHGNSAFRKDIVPIIHSQAAGYNDVVRFSQFSQGGQFAIQEKAQFLAHDIRELFRPLRESGT